MSYLVFARKWRPLTFDDVVGQEHVTATLRKAIEKGRVAHAYVFSGTRGVGKTTTARIMARALNCEKGPTANPCNECETCKNIMSGASFDVLEIDGASNNSVDDIRELRENIGYSSMSGKYRIYVIDEVHMLSKSAFNALLKTLEEPPKNVIFIFATTEPRKIPDTILSRCQRYDFRRISREKIQQKLEQICTAENISFERSGLSLIASRADGSMRDGLSLLDQVYSFCNDNISEKEVRSVLGLVTQEIFLDLINGVVQRNPAVALSVVEDVLLRGYDLHEFLLGLQDYIRGLLFSRIPGLIESDAPSAAAQNVARQFSEGDLLRMTEILRRAETDLRWSTYPRFTVEIALIKMATMDSSVSMEELLLSLKNAGPADHSAASPPPSRVSFEKPPAAPADTGSGTVKKNDQPHPERTVAVISQSPASIPPSAETAAAFGEPPNDVTDPVDGAALWQSLVKTLMQDRPNLGTFLSMGYIVAAAQPDVLDIRFASRLSFQFAEVTRKQNRDIIEAKAALLAGRPVTVHMTIEKKAETPAAAQTLSTAAPTRTALSLSLEDEIEHEPIIKNVIEIFDGEII